MVNENRSINLKAITRDVNAGLGNCELTFLPRVRIDVSLALQQHQQYQAALSALGCEAGFGRFRVCRGHRDGT
jgi:hypothetical protein